MFKKLLSAAAAVALIGSVAVGAEGKKEGACLAQGESIGAFYVTKVAGGDGDGVEQGQELCYRCRYGSRPMVMVFARDTGGKLPELIKQLDSLVQAKQDAKLASFVTLLGEDSSSLQQEGKKIATKTNAKNVPVVVAKENKTGPKSYKIPADAGVTIVMAKDSEVVATHAGAADELDVAALAKQVEGMVN